MTKDLDSLFDIVKELNELNHSENVNDKNFLIQRLTLEKRYTLIADFFTQKAAILHEFNEVLKKQKTFAQIEEAMEELNIFGVFKDDNSIL